MVAFDTFASTSVNADTTDHTLTLPDGTSPGHLLLGMIASREVADTQTWTWPSGWVVLYDGDEGGVRPWCSIAYRLVDGTEGYSGTGDTIPVTATDAKRAIALMMRFTDPSQANPIAGTAHIWQTIITPDSPALDLSPLPADDYLWLSLWARDALDGDPNTMAVPADYVKIAAVENTSFDSCQLGAAYRALNAQSEDPGAWGANTNQATAAFTIALQPEASGFSHERTVGSLVTGLLVDD